MICKPFPVHFPPRGRNERSSGIVQDLAGKPQRTFHKVSGVMLRDYRTRQLRCMLSALEGQLIGYLLRWAIVASAPLEIRVRLEPSWRPAHSVTKMNWPCSRDSTRDRAGRGEESPSQERRPDSLPMKVPRSGPQKTTPRRRVPSIKLTSSELMRLLRGPLVSASPSPFFFRDAPFQTTSR